MSIPGTDSTAATASTTGDEGGLRGRVLLGVLLAALGAGMAVLYGVGLWSAAVHSDRDAAAVLPQIISGLVVLGFAPMIGLIETQRPADDLLRDARPARPVRLAGWLAVTALTAAVHAVASAIAGVPFLVGLGFLLGAVGAVATSGILGRRARLARAARAAAGSRDLGEALTPDLDWTPRDIRRKRRLIVAAFVVVLAGSILVGVLFPRDGDDALLQTGTMIWSLSFLAAGITCLIVTMPALLSTGSVISDLPRAEQRVVARRSQGRDEPLEPELEWRAARLAAVSFVLQPFLLVQTLCIVMAMFVPVLVGGDLETWLMILLGVFAVFVLVMTPAMVRQVRGTRRYAAETRDLARSFGPDAVA
ncbi:MFS family permease [Clavibacter michiganensis]|uniref:hypothetical protein n=1 Tax=Clavibacter michiganensis TaxID=28447 RepID=UPI00195DB642|nr:hypothetical protein [Clavibacter michiganensis]MBM7412136.1 MFS family permease [Clavibacter michiganensis]